MTVISRCTAAAWSMLLLAAYITSTPGWPSCMQDPEGMTAGPDGVTAGPPSATAPPGRPPPWVVGYAGLTGPAWTSWLVGVLVVVVSQTVLRPFNWGRRRAVQQ